MGVQVTRGVAKERIEVEVRKLLELEGFPQPRMGRKEEDHSKIIIIYAKNFFETKRSC